MSSSMLIWKQACLKASADCEGVSLLIKRLPRTSKQTEEPTMYTLRYALVYIICIIVMRVLAEGRNPCCNRGSRGISVHSEEQHTGSEDSRFDCFNYHASNLHF
jgi:hypothetical protein